MNKNGEYEVKLPTRLGNLLSAYEGYSERVYGMNSVFYWHRIWLTLDEDLRNEIDTQQALVDSTIYVSTALICSGMLCFFYSVLNILGMQFDIYLPNPKVLALIGLSLFIVSYLIYRLSLYSHAQFGEIFKSVFDKFKDNISVESVINEVAEISKDPSFKLKSSREKYKIAWRWMQNGKIRPPNEG